MKKIYCENCGGDQLEARGDAYYCPHCHAVWQKHEIDEIYDKLGSILDEQKQERVASLRNQLFGKLNEENLDSEEIKRLCREIKGFLPDDFEATFFFDANSKSPAEVARLLDATAIAAHLGYAPLIADFIIKSLRQEHLLAINNFIERAFKADPKRYNEYTDKLAAEAIKVKRGVYDLAITRDVFVAYKSEDMPKVSELVETLENAGLSCFVAMRNMQHGMGAVANYEKRLQQAMDNCKVVVLVSSVMSRSTGDARDKELAYIKKRDLESAPAKYRSVAYDKLPVEYKKPRAEYVIENYANVFAEAPIKEFFAGFERRYTPQEVAKAVYELKDKVILENSQNNFKYCANCGAECKLNFKICPECGGVDFVESYREFSELQSQRAVAAALEKAKKETSDKFAELQAKLEAAIREAEQAKEQARKTEESRDEEAIRKEEEAREEEEARKAEEARTTEEVRKAEEAKKATKPYQIDGNSVTFGRYPQSKVTDGNLISALKRLAGLTPSANNSMDWTDYKYYIKNEVQSFMWYKDVSYGGEKYRAVYFDQWRPYSTNDSSSESNTYQGKNGYKLNTIYWFKWEPIKWKILQKSGGDLTLFSDMLLDSQHYYRNYDYRTINGKTIYPNNYAQSDIRAWLNNDFLSAAFDAQEKNLIKTTLVDNSLSSTGDSSNNYVCENTSDKIYLLSYQEAWDISDADRKRRTTDYARAQGACTETGDGNIGLWWLRSTGDASAFCVYNSGNVESNNVNFIDRGVAPALRIFDLECYSLDNYFLNEFEIDGTVLKKYKGKGGEVYIPDGVTELYGESFDGAFYKREDITSVIIPNTVTSIGKFAFEHCSGLTSIDIPNSVTSIGDFAFEDCRRLKSIDIPDSVTDIGARAFNDCTGLTSVTIPNSVKSIEEWAFKNCSGLTSITIPSSVTSIGWHAFSSCRGLTSITIPNSVTSIGEHAFYWCSGLTSIDIPNSVTSIGGSAFWGCSSLTSIDIPNSVTKIGSYAFYCCSGLTSITIPSSVISIDDRAFAWCSGLTSITIPNSVTDIGKDAFDMCSKLTRVTIPKRFDTGFLHKKLKEIFGNSYKHIKFTFI